MHAVRGPMGLMPVSWTPWGGMRTILEIGGLTPLQFGMNWGTGANIRRDYLIIAAVRIRQARNNRMPGACTTCMETYGNGVKTGRGIMHLVQWPIRLVLLRVPTGWAAAAVGVTIRGAAGRRIEAAAPPATATAAWAFASRERI